MKHPLAGPSSGRPLPETRRRAGGRERLRPTLTVFHTAFAERPDHGEPAGRVDGQQGNADPGRAVVEGPAENSRSVDFAGMRTSAARETAAASAVPAEIARPVSQTATSTPRAWIAAASRLSRSRTRDAPGRAGRAPSGRSSPA